MLAAVSMSGAAIEAQQERPPFTLQPSFSYRRGELYAESNAFFDERCFVSRWHKNSSASFALSKHPNRVFSPNAKMSDPDMCRQHHRVTKNSTDEEVAATHHPLPMTSCTLNQNTVVLPCNGGAPSGAEPPGNRTLRSPITKYCSEYPYERFMLTPDEAHWMRRCARISAPLIVVGMAEMGLHSENINHMGRDFSFLAGMMRLGSRSGYTVMIGDSPAVFKKMNSWGRNVITALRGRGLVVGNWMTETERFGQVAMRLPHKPAADAPTSEESGIASMREHASSHDVEPLDMSCGVVCATVASKYSVSGFAHPEDAVLLTSAVLEQCDLPLTPPTNRTLLLIARKGSTRVIRNLDEVEKHLKPFALSLGLEYQAVNMGALSFCEQVEYSAASYIMMGVHGADLANMLFQHADATVLELYGPGGGKDYELYPSSPYVPTAYLQQLAASGRRGVAARLVDVKECPGNDWMYSSKCELKLRAAQTVQVLERWMKARRRF